MNILKIRLLGSAVAVIGMTIAGTAAAQVAGVAAVAPAADDGTVPDLKPAEAWSYLSGRFTLGDLAGSGMLGNLGIGGDVTYRNTEANYQISATDVRQTSLPQAPDLIFNAELFYAAARSAPTSGTTTPAASWRRCRMRSRTSTSSRSAS